MKKLLILVTLAATSCATPIQYVPSTAGIENPVQNLEFVLNRHLKVTKVENGAGFTTATWVNYGQVQTKVLAYKEVSRTALSKDPGGVYVVAVFDSSGKQLEEFLVATEEGAKALVDAIAAVAAMK